MEIYYIIFAVLIFAAVIFDTFPSRLSPLLEFAMFSFLALYLILFVGFRTTGLEADYSRYKIIFNEIAGLTELGQYRGYKIEYGYMLFNRLFSWATFHTFIFALAFITVLPKEIYIYKHCSRKFLALAYYFAMVLIQNDMGLLRATAASGILYYGFDFLSRDEKKKFILTVCIASLFHITSFTMLLLLIPGNKKYSMRTYLYIIVLGLLISSLHLVMPLFNFIFRTLTGGGSFIAKFQTLYERVAEGGDVTSMTRLFLSNSRRIVIFLLFSYLLRVSHRLYSDKKCRLIQVWYNSYFINIVLPLMLIDLGGLISHRGTLFFRPVEIFLMSELYDAVSKRKVNRFELLAEKFLLLLFIIYLMYHNMIDIIHTYPGYVPYKWDF